jgi:hypothetical protein
VTDTQIAITEERRRQLKWVKALTLSRGYDEAIEALIEESELEIPEGDPTQGRMRRLVLEGQQ